MNRKEILEQFEVDNGIIQDSGKFEGEMLYAPYFYDVAMEGGADETVYDLDRPIDIFIISKENSEEFPELKDIYAVAVSVSDDGFVNLTHFETKENFDEAMKEFEEQEEYEEEV